MPIYTPSTNPPNDSIRKFSRLQPYLWVYPNLTGMAECVIALDEARNQPHMDYYLWEDVYDAPDTESESHIVRQHLSGIRLHLTISFDILDPKFSPKSAHKPQITGFTELDLMYLQNARVAGKVLVLFPHGNVVVPPDLFPQFIVNMKILNSGRGNDMTEHKLSLDFTGVNPTSSWMSGFPL